METVYLICAILGGTLMLCQFVLTLVGLGGHHDLGGDHTSDGGDVQHDLGHYHHEPGHHEESSWFFKLLTFRTIVAALLFFGLAGLAASARVTQGPLLPLAIAVAAGGAAVLFLAWDALLK